MSDLNQSAPAPAPGAPPDYSAMSIRDLRRILTLRGVDCSQYHEKSELIAEARRLDATDYDVEARRLFSRLHLTPTSRHRWSNLDAVWRHPTETGGTVYVGNYIAASDRRTLDERGIAAVVNCQGSDSQNYFESDGENMTYHRFPVARVALSRHYAAHGQNSTCSAYDGFRPTFDFIDAQISAGKSVLIHCLAGAHRAGTAGVAYLMYKTGMGVDESILVAKECRPVIGPFATLLELLYYLEADLKRQGRMASSSK